MGKAKGSSSTNTGAYSPRTARQKEAITKRRGELAELAFLYKAANLGYGVAKPYGDSERYDFILDCQDKDCQEKDLQEKDCQEQNCQEYDCQENGCRENDCPESESSELDPAKNAASGKLWRVQVKSTTTLLNGLYRINAHRRTVGRAIPYQPSEVDFLAAYVIPEDSWFIFPIQEILDRTSLLLAPKNWPRPSVNDGYREAWHLFRAPA